MKISQQDYITDAEKSQATCPKCFKDVPDGALFCCWCGTRLDKKTANPKRRGNGTGSVYKHGSGWRVEIVAGWFLKDGKARKKIRRKDGFRTKKEALAYIETLRSQKEKPKTIKMQQLWELFEQSEMPELSKSKQTAYRIAWKKVSEHIAFTDICELSVPELQKVTDSAGTSYYTKRDIKNLLSHLYKLAIRDDFEDKNRAQYIKLPENQSEERTVFTDDEIRAIWKHSDSMIAKSVLVMIFTGMRPGEILGMQKENIHLDEHYMTGGIKTKKSKNRKIIIPNMLTPILTELLDISTGKKLLTINKDRYYELWKEYKEEHGLRDELSLYCCRHTYITNLTALKVSPAMLQELAGHEDYDTTLEYTHLSISDRLAEVNRMEKIIFG